jgi:hypothetical protein
VVCGREAGLLDDLSKRRDRLQLAFPRFDARAWEKVHAWLTRPADALLWAAFLAGRSTAWVAAATGLTPADLRAFVAGGKARLLAAIQAVAADATPRWPIDAIARWVEDRWPVYWPLDAEESPPGSFDHAVAAIRRAGGLMDADAKAVHQALVQALIRTINGLLTGWGTP